MPKTLKRKRNFKKNAVNRYVPDHSTVLQQIKTACKEISGPDKVSDPKDISTREFWEGQVDLLQIEWAIQYPDISVKDFLVKIKGFSVRHYDTITKRWPAEQWNKRREHFQDKVTEKLVSRHVDLIAKVQEQHTRASNIGLAKAIEMLSKFQIEPMRDKKGKIIYDEFTGKPIYKGFRSIDLLNCMNAIEKAQLIYRRAMGLPNDGEGLAQILERIQERPTTQNIQIINNVSNEAPKDAVVSKVKENLSYDEIMMFVSHKRERMVEQKKQLKAQREMVKLPAPAPRQEV